ncbi:MAG: methionyl-tRNA formyltransferase [Vicinamibacterales bacterium]
MVVGEGLRIVFFGTPAFAVPTLVGLANSRHHVVALVSQPDRPKGRGHRVQMTPTKEVALARGIPVLQPERIKDPEFLERIMALRPDLGVVAAYGRIIPDALLNAPRHGMINVHASILPKYRGAAPVHRAVIAGETETGVTIMRLVTELDAGPTFATRRRAIGEDETSTEVEQALAVLGAGLLLEVVEAIAEGRAFETPQDDSHATFAPKLTKAEGRIDWRLPAQTIHNVVRGLQPWPLAAARLGDERVLIHRTRKMPPTASAHPTQPGSIIVAEASGIIVACGDGLPLQILQLQPEGSRAMSAREYLAGHKIPAGARLETP